MLNIRRVLLFMFLMVIALGLSGCLVPRAAAGVTKGVVKGTAKGAGAVTRGTGKAVRKTGSVVTKPLR